MKIKQAQTSIPIEIFNGIYLKKKLAFNFDHLPALERQSMELLQEDLKSLKLNGFGNYFAHALIKKCLNNFHWIQNLQTTTTDLKLAPIIILGLPRTGSTLFFNLLAADTKLRSLNYWESMDFNPAISTEKKYKKGKLAHRLTDFFSPQLKAIHEVRLEGPGECTQILPNTLMGISFACYFHLPQFSNWTLAQDMTESYANHRRQLAILDSQKQWILKAPPHFFAFKDMMNIYPNAKVIHLHRHPVEVVGSTASLISASRNLFDRGHQLKTTGIEISKGLTWATNEVMNWRKQNPHKIYDIMYPEFISNPLEVMEKLYQNLGLNWDENVKQNMQQELRSSIQNKFGKHEYELADYGLKPEVINERFKHYIQFFSL